MNPPSEAATTDEAEHAHPNAVSPHSVASSSLSAPLDDLSSLGRLLSGGGLTGAAGGPSGLTAIPPPTSPASSSTSLMHLVEQIGMLYKSKLSLSLRTVQLRRLMREQFLSDLHHPTENQAADDAEIARWIASSALSQLEIEIEDEQHGHRSFVSESDAAHDEDEEDEECDGFAPPRYHDDEQEGDRDGTTEDTGTQRQGAQGTHADAFRASPLDLAVRAALTPTHGPAPTPPTPVVASPDGIGEVALPAAPSFPPLSHSPFSGSSNQTASPPAAPPTAPHSAAHLHAHNNTATGTTLNLALPTSIPVAGAARSDGRSATPIVAGDEPHLAHMIGSGFNTKRGVSATSPSMGPMPIRRSSTSDMVRGTSAAAAAAAAASAAQYATGSGGGGGSAASPTKQRNVFGGASSATAATTSPALASLPPSGRSSPMHPIAPVPLTAFALVSDPPGASRSVSHPPSPVVAVGSLSAAPPLGITRSISENLVPRERDGHLTASTIGSRAVSHHGTPPRRQSRIYFTLSPAVTEALHRTWQWEFDLWEFVDLVPDTPLTTMTCYLLERWGLFSTFNIDRATFHRFISRIESGYLDNPYHNRIHACDVVQNIHALLLGFVQRPARDAGGALCASLTPLDVLASIVAAAIHDYKHTGTTNLFHTNTVSDLAIRYNDQSVLENMHLSESFALIHRHPECDIFASLSRDQRRELRETMIQMVLSTDMSKHIVLLTDLQANIEQKRAKGTWFDVSSRADRLLLLKNCLHMADVANPTKPTGDLERSLKLEISPMMDRGNANVEKSQIGFIDFFIAPLYTTWAQITPLTSIPLEYLKINRAYWVEHDNQKQAAAAGTAAAAAAAAAATATATANTTTTTTPRAPSDAADGSCESSSAGRITIGAVAVPTAVSSAAPNK